ncbi:hypothetical protein N7495_007272 [Penicillium taxi]|uniref:uncharacterized protein n=1 Tax=Penicillium taxi TaxID=168475 RepID=UPI002545729E|nr:uncharacterized protein N7495_007272 [Penicillium taxi]KAJ5895581.1 hypothetical protein N7495_007272 [Penicillium taxi]
MLKTFAFISLFSVGTLAHPSGLWWGTDFCYPSPDNTDNSCLPSQKNGFDWSDLADGDNWTFEGFNFVGFQPTDACGSSQGKCIQGKLSRDDNYVLQVDAADAPFSVQKFHLSTSRKTDVLLIYGMADGSVCHQVAFASPEGTDVTNDQCGGATWVKFALPEQSKFGECDLNIHDIDFDCNPGPKPPITPSHSVPIPSHTAQPSFSEPSSSFQEPKTTVQEPKTTVQEPKTTVQEPKTTVQEPKTTWTEKIPVSSTHTTTSCSSSKIPVLTTSWSPSSEPVHTTVIPVSTSAVPSSPPLVPAPCPEIVPKCMNTWLSIPNCKSNSDTACFCPSSEYVAKVDSCIHAWSTSDEQEKSALSYFAGICAPKNPAVINIVPSGKPSKPSVPELVPEPSHTHSITSKAPPCTTMTWSSHTATVPLVGFSTVTGPSSTTVALVAITPTATPSPTSRTAHPLSPVSMTTSCGTHTSSFSTATTSKPSPTAPPTEIPTFAHSNAGSKNVQSGMWSFGVALLALFMY